MSGRSPYARRVLFAFFIAIVSLVGIGAACNKGSSNSGQALAERGRVLVNNYGCLSCHTTDGSKSVAPSWKGLSGSEVELEDGSKVIANDEYLRESIAMPSDKTVKGFQKGLMETVIQPGEVPSADIEALVAYIKTL